MNLSEAEALGIRFHHLGLLTDRPDAAASALALFGYRVATSVHDPLQDVDLRMAEGASEFARIELITPRSRDGALAKLITRRGDYMYHSCFTVKDVAATLAALSARGLRVATVSAAKPAVLFGGKQVSFHAVDGIGLVEFIEDAG
jgi:hypothetical protein